MLRFVIIAAIINPVNKEYSGTGDSIYLSTTVDCNQLSLFIVMLFLLNSCYSTMFIIFIYC